MILISLSDYWERLESHNWHYAWASNDDGYADLVEEDRVLWHMSMLSESHAQLYASYYRMVYSGMDVENNVIMNADKPEINKPEAA